MVEKFQEGRLVQLRLTAVDSRRNRIFSSKDFLTGSHIAGFSSRLVSNKPLSGEGDHVEALVGTARAENNGRSPDNVRPD